MSALIPRMAPVAPVIATTIRRRPGCGLPVGRSWVVAISLGFGDARAEVGVVVPEKIDSNIGD